MSTSRRARFRVISTIWRRLRTPFLRRQPRRRWRWGVRVVIFGPLLLVIAALLLARSPVVGWAVQRIVGSTLGCQCDATSVSISADGRLMLRNLTLSVHGLRGSAAEILSASRLEADLDWSGVWSGGITVRSLILTDPTIRISQSTRDGALNIQGLSPSQGGGGSSGPPPRIEIIEGAVILAEHDPGGEGYRELTRFRVAGAFSPAVTDRPVYTVQLQEVGRPIVGVVDGVQSPEAANAGQPLRSAGMSLTGQVNLETLDASLKLESLSLARWNASAAPSRIRALWERLNIREGEVAQSIMTFSRSAGLSVNTTVRGITMSLLVPSDRPEDAGTDRLLEIAKVDGSIRLGQNGLEAEITGIVGDLPCEVVLTTSGTSLESAVRCAITTKRFNVGKNPELMPFAPRVVRKRFVSFSGPTAEMDARVEVRRGDPVNGVAAPFKVRGAMSFQNGAAAYNKFPYPIKDMSGRVEFDDDSIEIVNIQGRAETGAILSARGVVAPVDDNAGLDLEIIILDVPTDDVLRAAMSDSRRKAFDAVFSSRKYDELVAKGLIIGSTARNAALAEEQALQRVMTDLDARAAPPDAAERLVAAERLNSVQQCLARPVFDLGGTGQIRIHVYKTVGPSRDADFDVLVAFPRAGLLAKVFPYPLVATGAIVRITETTVDLVQGRFVGLNGAAVDLDVGVTISADGKKQVRPTVHAASDRVTVDPLLIEALPGPPSATPDADSARRLVKDLHLNGDIRFEASAETESMNEDGTPEMSFDVTVAPADAHDERSTGLSAKPFRSGSGFDDAPVSVAITGGEVRVTDDSLSLHNVALTLMPFVSVDTPSGPPPGWKINGSGSFEHGNITSSDLTIDAAHFAPELEIAKFVDVFSPSGGRAIRKLQSQFAPEGRLDGSVRIAQSRGDQPRIHGSVINAAPLKFNAYGGRFEVLLKEGTIDFGSAGANAVDAVLAGARAEVHYNDQAVGEVNLDGEVSFNDGALRIPEGRTVNIRADHAVIESALVSRIIDHAVPQGVVSALRAYEPSGLISTDLVLTGRPGDGDAAAKPILTGTITPNALSLRRGGFVVPLKDLSGRLTLNADSGTLDQLSAAGDHWRCTFNGNWAGSGGDADGPHLAALIDLEGSRINSGEGAAAGEGGGGGDGGLVHLLPIPAMQALAALKVTLPAADRDANLPRSSFIMRGARWKIGAAPGNSGIGTTFDGEIAFSGVGFEAGLPFTNCEGQLRLSTSQVADEATSLSSDLVLDHGEAAGITFSNLSAEIMSGRGSSSRPQSVERIIIPRFSADVHGGRVAGAATLERPLSVARQSRAASPTLKSRPDLKTSLGPDNQALFLYQSSIALSGVGLSPFLNDWAPTPAVPDQSSTRPDEMSDGGGEGGGVIDASLSLAGLVGQPLTRRGVGTVRLSSMSMAGEGVQAGDDRHQNGGVNLPFPKSSVLYSIMELSNLQAPGGEMPDFVHTSCRIIADSVIFDHIAALSDRISIIGQGVMVLPQREFSSSALNFWFNSRSIQGRRLPVISNIVETLRDEIITTIVTGTLARPQIRGETLVGTRRLLGSIVGGEGAAGGGAPGLLGEIDPSAIESAAETERQRLTRQRRAPIR